MPSILTRLSTIVNPALAQAFVAFVRQLQAVTANPKSLSPEEAVERVLHRMNLANIQDNGSFLQYIEYKQGN